MKRIIKSQLNEPITLRKLIDYNNKVFLPKLEETFVMKGEFYNVIVKSENSVLNRLDKILKEIEKLHNEEVRIK